MGKDNGVPFGSFGFKVKVEGANGSLGCFQEVSGLSAQINTTDVVEGGVNNTTHKILGNTTYSNVTLKRGLCDGTMFDWVQKFMSGKVERMSVTIELLKDDGTTAVTYKLAGAVPVKWDGPSLSVMQDGIATESLELAHEGLSVSMGG